MRGLYKIQEAVEAAMRQRRRMPLHMRDHYSMPDPGAFTGEHTKFVVVEPRIMQALLAVAEDFEDALEYVPDYFREKWGYDETLAQLREVIE